MNRTPFYDHHKNAGARLIEFGGWEMPVQFEGIIAEHKAVREKAGVFDISHMGQVWVTGSGAADYLQRLVTSDVASLPSGKGAYALMCREDGAVVDDLYVYRLGPERFFVVVNASRSVVDLQWMRDQIRGAKAEIVEQLQPAGLALQGPNAESVLKKMCPEACGLPRNGLGEFSLADGKAVISRTGYTGEDGFEIFGSAKVLLPFYSQLFSEGESLGLKPIGLGARDTLRLEMGYRLYGNDLDEQHTALEAGLGWVIKFEKNDFVGRDALLREKTRGSARRFIAFRLTEKGVPRHGHGLYFKGRHIGDVSSGTFSPSLQVGIGMGFVDARAYPKEAEKETGLAVKVHEREIAAERSALPFYKKTALVV